MSKAREQEASFHVGDRVKFALGKRQVSGVVIEDRGGLGVGGRRLYRVEVPMDPDEPVLYTMPEGGLKPDEDLETRRNAMTKAKILNYLKEGGLVSILLHNTSGGKNQPRVWLCFDHLGNLTHTFSAERGLVGGDTVPFGTLYENNRIFTPKEEQVISFLASFGLNRQESEEVIRAIGTAP